MCWSWFNFTSRVVNPPPRKSNQLSLAMGDMLYKYLMCVARLVFAWPVTFINILEMSALAYAGPFLVPGSLSLHVR